MVTTLNGGDGAWWASRPSKKRADEHLVAAGAAARGAARAPTAAARAGIARAVLLDAPRAARSAPRTPSGSRPAPAEHHERRGLAVQPVRRERRRLRPLVALDHRQDLRAVAGPQRVGVRLPEARPVPEGARDRVAAVQEDQVGDARARARRPRSRDPLHHVAAHAAVQRRVSRPGRASAGRRR